MLCLLVESESTFVGLMTQLLPLKSKESPLKTAIRKRAWDNNV
ncbi:MAG: hypothetical protein ACD_7C00510G0007 [uncultured bacterium]|nr:MAG: hypothetical protein ACD_7C00510G0007 [uncultured bacterium]